MEEEKCVTDKNNGFEKFYRKYYFLIYSVSLPITRSSDDSQDVVAEVFEKIWAISCSFKDERSVAAFACQCAKNLSIDILRHRRHYDLLSQNSSAVLSASSPQADALSYEELVETIYNVLSAEESTVFLLHAQEKLTFKKISKIFNTSCDTTSSLYFRAKNKLRKDKRIIQFFP